MDPISSTITETKAWATSSGGRLIPHYKSACNEGRPLLWLGGVHGDEPEGVHLSRHLLKWLSDNPENINESLNWHLIPCLNPDGIEQGQRTNDRGVDLNRNFPSEDWSPEHSKPRYFPGDKPGSEPEVSALVELIQEIQPFLIVHCHAYEPSLTYTGEPARPFAEWLNHELNYEIQPDIGYPTPGSLGQYGWLNHQTPVICIEVQEGLQKENIETLFDPGMKNFFRQLCRN